MTYRILADAVLLGHLGFILFVLLGGVAVRWWRWMTFVHLPCAVYGAAIEHRGWICPLTPLENRLRALAGERGYTGGFVERYLVPVVYPEPLSAAAGNALAIAVVVANLVVYAWALRSRHSPVEPSPGRGAGHEAGTTKT